MNNFQKILQFSLLFGLLLNNTPSLSQDTNDKTIYNWFDKSIEKENLSINNGIVHSNPYKTAKDNNMYFSADKFDMGTLVYETQTYYDIYLKYDLYNDILVLSPSGLSNNIGINLGSDKVSSFTLKGIHFVRRIKQSNNPSEFITGFYEENKISPTFLFYIKHHKDIQKIVNENGLSYKFKENNAFFIDYKNTLYYVKNKNDIIAVFANQKKIINEYYTMNNELRKTDLNQFMRNLMVFVSNTHSIQTKLDK